MSTVDAIGVQLTAQQQAIADTIIASQDFRQSLAGLAGTGKTVLAKHIYDAWINMGLSVVVMAPTGKAAVVLRAKGVPAVTIHRAIYHYGGKWEDERGEVQLIFRDNGKTQFADRLIVDEASMVTAKMQADIESRGIPTLWVGDPGQLSPVKAKATELLEKPTHRLTEIHRQAADNPILKLAYAVRRGAELTYRVEGINYVEVRGQGSLFVAQQMLEHKIDRLIVATNAQRIALNRAYRDCKGLTGIVAEGDEIICCANNHRLGVVNGEIFRVLQVEASYPNYTRAIIESIDTRERSRQWLWNAQFGQDCRLDDVDQEFLLADYGYAATCHRFQGSSAKHIGVAARGFKTESARWNYTAVTRAEERLTIFY